MKSGELNARGSSCMQEARGRGRLHAIGIVGWSGAGKTTLIEQLIPLMRQQGCWVATVKHAHCGFDVDQVGKDSWRHRQAGASEVVIASERRMVIVREAESQSPPDTTDLLGQLRPPIGADAWVLVEGFHAMPVTKIEVWRPSLQKGLRAAGSEGLMALASPQCGREAELQHAGVPGLPLGCPATIVRFLLEHERMLRWDQA